MSRRRYQDVPADAVKRRVADPPQDEPLEAVGLPERTGPADVSRLLALQSQIGNQAVSRMLQPRRDRPRLMRNPITYAGKDREMLGNVTIKADRGLITAKGTVLRPPKGGGTSVVGGGLEEVAETPLEGSIDYHPDPDEKTRWVIGTMKCEPKRTGVGMLLAYHLAKEAKAAGIKTLGTDLSALEEGTPEFYQAIGLTPSPERVDMAVDAVSGMPAATATEREKKAKKQKDIMYSARLDADIDVVLNLTGASFEKYWTANGATVAH